MRVEISNMSENLPKETNTGNLCITITEPNPNFQTNKPITKTIDQIQGIKIPLYKHQKVLIKQIIDSITQGYLTCDNNTIQTNNFWLKSSIGTGKSLCLLSIIQYFKNINYSTIPKKVPYKMNLLQMIRESDKFFQQQPFLQKGLYKQLHNLNYYNFDISKQQSYCINNQGQFIEYTDFRPQTLLFSQNQVFKQFEEYIKDQTSLTYFPVNTNQDFLKFILENPKEDIILWNVDQINIENIGIMLTDYVKQYNTKNNITDQAKVISDQDYINKNYPNLKKFNDFWMQYQKLNDYKPWAFIAYDDFDMMQIPSFYPINSLVNMFVGSTMIERMNPQTNPCNSFIINKHLNYITGFKINETQLQQILQLPPNHIHSILCSTPSKVYMQFQILKYLQKMFEIVKPEVKNVLIFNNQVFSDLLMNKTSFEKLFEELKKYGLIFESLIYSPEFLLDLINNIKMICFGDLILENAKRLKLPEEQVNLQMNKAVIPFIYKDIDETFQNELYKSPRYKDIINQFMKNQFQLNKEDLILNKVVCPFKKLSIVLADDILNTDCYITRCCSQPFEKNHLNEVIYYANGNRYCEFCQKQINDIDHQIFDIAKQQYLVNQKIEQTNTFKQELVQHENLTKIQQLFKLIKENFLNKNIMIITKDSLKEQDVQQLYQPDELTKDTPEDKHLETIINYTRKINVHQIGEVKRNYQNIHKTNAIRYAQYLIQQQLVKHEIIEQIVNYDFQEESEADLTIVKSLHQIIGANMTYIDQFIFFNVPEQQEEIYQIVGRSRRIGRNQNQDIDSFFLYYPLEKQTRLDY